MKYDVLVVDDSQETFINLKWVARAKWSFLSGIFQTCQPTSDAGCETFIR